MRKLDLLGRSSVAALSAVLISAPLASAADGQQGEQVISLVAKTTQFTPNGTGDAQGNGFTLANDLYREDQRVGSGGGTCTITRLEAGASTGTLQCLITFALTDGDITVQGHPPYAPPPSDFNLAITGGTGSYETSRGYVHGHVVDDTTTELTFHIVP
ncbi:allene oxide cyclase barrel-like domain-containing protein [Streptomyces sp. NPDC002004]